MDYILITSPCAQVLSETVEALKADSTLTSTEILSQYLGMNLWKTTTREICLNTEKHDEKLQGTFWLISGRKRMYTPLPPLESEGLKPVRTTNEFEYLS